MPTAVERGQPRLAGAIPEDASTPPLQRVFPAEGTRNSRNSYGGAARTSNGGDGPGGQPLYANSTKAPPAAGQPLFNARPAAAAKPGAGAPMQPTNGARPMTAEARNGLAAKAGGANAAPAPRQRHSLPSGGPALGSNGSLPSVFPDRTPDGSARSPTSPGPSPPGGAKPGAGQSGPREKFLCKNKRAEAMEAQHDLEGLTAEWAQMMRVLQGENGPADVDEYTLACAILMVKEGIINHHQQGQPAFSHYMCTCCMEAQPLDMEMLDGLFNGAVTKLRQSGNKHTVAPILEFNGMTNADRMVLLTNIYGMYGGKGMPKRAPRRRPNHIATQTDNRGKDFSQMVDLIPKPPPKADGGCQTEPKKFVDGGTQTDPVPGPEQPYQQLLRGFPGADPDRLAGFAAAAAEHLAAMAELAASMKAAGPDAAQQQAAGLAMASAVMTDGCALGERGAEDGSEEVGKLNGVGAALGKVQERLGGQLEGAALLAGDKPPAEGEQAPTAPDGLAAALAALAAMQEQLGRIGSGGVGVCGLDGIGADALAESGLPSLVPLQLQLQDAGAQLVRGLSAAAAACLAGGAGAAAATNEAAAAAARAQRLLRVLADETALAAKVLALRPRSAATSAAHELLSELGAVAEARHAAIAMHLEPALGSLTTLCNVWGRASDGGAAMALIHQLLSHLHAFSCDLLAGARAAHGVQARGAAPLGEVQKLMAGGSAAAADTAAAAAAHLDALAAAVEALYQGAAAPKAAHASALVPLLQGNLLSMGVMLDAWAQTQQQAWDVSRAHAMREAIDSQGLPSYQDLLAEKAQLLQELKEKMEAAEASIKKLQEEAEANQKKLKEAEAEVKRLQEEAEAAKKRLEELEAEMKRKEEEAESKFKKLQGKAEAMQKQLEEAGAEIRRLQQEAEAAEKRREELEEEMRRRQEEAEVAAKEAEEKLKKLQEQLEATVREGDEAYQAALAKAKAAEDALADLFGPGKGMNPEEAAAARAQIAQLQEALQEAERKLAEAEARVKDLESGGAARIKELETQLADAAAKLKAAEKNAQDKGAELEALRREVAELKKKIEELEAALAKALEKPAPPVVDKKGCFGCGC